MTQAPFILSLGRDPSAYAPALCLLLALFVLRVIGQVIVVLSRPRWLPEMKQWYSGLLPYPVLLPIQIVYIVVMAWIALDFARGAGTFVTPRPALGIALIWVSYVYAAGMLVRFGVWLRKPPAERRAWIPILFHIVLAAYLWVFASWHAGPATQDQPANTKQISSNTHQAILSTAYASRPISQTSTPRTPA